MTLSCFQLTEFGIADPIVLEGAAGLVKICRSCARSLLGAGTVLAAGSFDLQ